MPTYIHPSRLYSIGKAHTHMHAFAFSSRAKANNNDYYNSLLFIDIAYYIICRYLAKGSSFRSLAFLFRIGVTTVGKIVSETVMALWEELHEEHMPVPTKESFKMIAENFYSIWNFPNCVGSIDGKHIRVQCPKNSGSMYFNNKKFFSIVLQAVADAHYKFIAVDV